MRTTLGMFASALLFTSGCVTPSPTALPPGSVKVGGGLAVEWRASSNGTVILYDSTNRRMVTTRTVGAGEMFLFPNSENDERVLEAFYPEPGEAGKARFELFFVTDVRQ